MSDYVGDWELHAARHADCPQDAHGDCALHEPCDELECWTLKDPQTIEELRAALDHWRDHGYLNGCSHAC